MAVAVHQTTTRPILLLEFYDQSGFSTAPLNAVLRGAGFDVATVLLKSFKDNQYPPPTRREEELLVDLAATLHPLFIGVSVCSFHFPLAARLTAALRQRVDSPVIWGGIHATLRPHQCLDHADAVCLGEGEGAVLEVARGLDSGSGLDDIQDIPNVWVKRAGSVRSSSSKFRAK